MNPAEPQTPAWQPDPPLDTSEPSSGAGPANAGPPAAPSEVVQPEPNAPANGRAAPMRTRWLRDRMFPFMLAAALLAGVASSGATYALLTATSRLPNTQAATTVGAVLTSSSSSLVEAVARAKASVVTIEITAAGGPFGQQVSGAGTGIIVSSDGLILTNKHVVSGASSIQVTLPDGMTVAGTVYGTSSTTDLAIVKVNATGLTAATLRTASPAVGETVLAIGDPLGQFEDSVTAGIVSGLDRSISVENENLSGLIQTDAPVNGGNSGGPLIDANGDVVGVVTASSSSAQGISFAIPITAATSIVSQALAGQAIS